MIFSNDSKATHNDMLCKFAFGVHDTAHYWEVSKVATNVTNSKEQLIETSLP